MLQGVAIVSYSQFSPVVFKIITPGFVLFPLDFGNVFVKYSLEERETMQAGREINTRYYLYSN